MNFGFNIINKLLLFGQNMYLSENQVESANQIGLKNFCEQTSIHGWSFIAFSKFKLLHAIFWLVVIVGAFAGCLSMIYDNAMEFKDATVEFQTETLTESLDNLFFPSIYISNKNALRRSYFMELLKDPKLKNITTLNEIISLTAGVRLNGRLPQNPMEMNINKSKMRKLDFR